MSGLPDDEGDAPPLEDMSERLAALRVGTSRGQPSAQPPAAPLAPQSHQSVLPVQQPPGRSCVKISDHQNNRSGAFFETLFIRCLDHVVYEQLQTCHHLHPLGQPHLLLVQVEIIILDHLFEFFSFQDHFSSVHYAGMPRFPSLSLTLSLSFSLPLLHLLYISLNFYSCPFQ